MNPKNPAPDVLESEVHGSVPMPVTPGDNTIQPEGVAFHVAEGTEMPGVPTGSQRPTNEDSAQVVEEKVEVPPGGMNHTRGQNG